MHMRGASTVMHNREKLMSVAFDGIGGLPMATIDKYREMRAQEVEGREKGVAGEESGSGRKGAGAEKLGDEGRAFWLLDEGASGGGARQARSGEKGTRRVQAGR